MKNNILATLSKEEIQKCEKLEAYDFLFLIVNQYLNHLATSKNPEFAINDFSDDQHTLLAYNYLYIQVGNGGFLQLIQNGYGLYIFETPFSLNIKKFEVDGLACIVDEAKKIYEDCKSDMEKLSEDEFNQKYDYYEKKFAPLDARFIDIMDDENEKIKEYVLKNLKSFAAVM